MCRNIKTLFNFDPPVTAEEIRGASLQFVRKISGFNKPSRANEAAFLAAVDEIAAISGRLIHSLEKLKLEPLRDSYWSPPSTTSDCTPVPLLDERATASVHSSSLDLPTPGSFSVI